MPLLAPEVGRTGPPESGLADDRAPDWVPAGTPQPLRGELAATVPATPS